MLDAPLCGISLSAAPTEKPVTLAELKAHLRVEHSADDTYIGAVLDSAISHFDGETGVLGRALITQDWQANLSDWPDELVLPCPPLQQVVSVKYLDSAAAEQTWDGANYHYRQYGALYIWSPKPSVSLPTLAEDRFDAVRILVRCGWTTATVPRDIKLAIMTLAARSYGDRGDGMDKAEVNAAANYIDMIVEKYRVRSWR